MQRQLSSWGPEQGSPEQENLREQKRELLGVLLCFLDDEDDDDEDDDDDDDDDNMTIC